MTSTLVTDHLTSWVLDALDETFEQVHGIYLDGGTSLFETLATVSAADASIPVGQQCASIAAQVEHVRFYLEVLERHMLNEDIGRVDWKEIWNRVEAVTPEEWETSKKHLKETYQRVLELIKGFDGWEGENDISGALAVVVHTAYHLGEIRQALCTIQTNREIG